MRYTVNLTVEIDAKSAIDAAEIVAEHADGWTYIVQDNLNESDEPIVVHVENGEGHIE